jgi:hypothetical protein
MTKGAPGRLRVRWRCPLCNSRCPWSDIRQISPLPGQPGHRPCSISLQPHASFSRTLLCYATGLWGCPSCTATLLMRLFDAPRRFFIPRAFAPEASFRRPPHWLRCQASTGIDSRLDARELPFPVPHRSEAVSPGLHASPEDHPDARFG